MERKVVSVNDNKFHSCWIRENCRYSRHEKATPTCTTTTTVSSTQIRRTYLPFSMFFSFFPQGKFCTEFVAVENTKTPRSEILNSELDVEDDCLPLREVPPRFPPQSFPQSSPVHFAPRLDKTITKQLIENKTFSLKPSI